MCGGYLRKDYYTRVRHLVSLGQIAFAEFNYFIKHFPILYFP